MSLKHNILANYTSQIYVTVINIVMVPVQFRYMGAEAYGLVGFFAMLQVWFQMLDMGLTPTMARETARFRGGASDSLSLHQLLRALEGIFIGVALLGITVMMLTSGIIADKWLKVQHLPLGEVQHAIMLMAVIVALRWVCGLYRGTVNGFERLVWLSGFNIITATARFVMVIPVLAFIGNSPTIYFGYQLILAVIEVVTLAIKAYRLMPRLHADQRIPWQWEPLRSVFKFSMTIAFTSSIWVLVTQTDKLVLSKILPLTDYAYFILAVLAASGVTVVSGPVSSALLPRLTKLNAEGADASLIHLYRNATQLVSVIAIPASLVLAFFAENVLWIWTGNSMIASHAAPILILYALGNGVLVLEAFPYYLQFAKGDLKLHLIGNALFVVVLLPTLIWATLHFGVIGAGFTWLGTNVIYFLCWVPRVHMRFMKGLHLKWLRDVGAIVLFSVFGASLLKICVIWPLGRAMNVMVLCIISLGMLTIAAVGSAWVRETISRIWLIHFSFLLFNNGKDSAR